jgi:glyoxylase-like metal-dependent hydrolase (beta-lactamase superfamily II)
MKKNKIYKTLLAFVILLLIGLFTFIIYFQLTLHFDEEVSQRLTEDVIVINDIVVSMYLIKYDSGYIAIDTGYFDCFIKRGLEYNNISTDDIKYVLLTHSDADHVNNVHLFNKAKIYFPLNEKKMLDNKKQRFAFLSFYTNKIEMEKFTFTEDHDELILGNKKVQCISLPGHTEGSMGYFIDNKYLFTGDAFRLKNGKISLPFRKYFVTDQEAMLKSIDKVSKLDSVKYIFTAHSGFTADFNFAVK